MRYAALAIAVIAVGCATPAIMRPTRYVLDARIEVTPVSAAEQTLGVRPLEPARPYKQKIVYRESEFELEDYELFEWAEMPRDVVTRALVDALVASRRFKDVGAPEDMALSDVVLTGQLRKFEENQMTDPWTAECEIRLELRETKNPQAVWAATLCAKESLAHNDPAALPAAMSRAVQKVVKEAVDQIVAR